MLLTERSIQLARDASVTQVIGHYMKLDRNSKGCCPFHNEKTPSFSVSEKRGIYKCFGCGESGDALSFVMKQDKLDFVKAVEKVAEICGFTLEYEEVPDPEKYQQQKETKDLLKEVLHYTVTHYRTNLWNLPADNPVMQYLAGRKLTKEHIAEWQLGWATEEWKHLTGDLVNRNWYDPASKLGLIKRSASGENMYDGYRSRITFPITNPHGEFIGMGGRFFLVDPDDTNKNFPKYINSPENEIYNKSAVLYGLSQAQRSIKEKGFAILVEGYMDVISLHINGLEHTVGTCGTALTPDQAKLLKKYTDHVVVLRDGDKAGLAATQKDIPVLLKVGFKVEVSILPDGEDPDSFIQKQDTDVEGFELFKVQGKSDAIHWQVKEWVREADGDPHKLGIVKQRTIDLLSKISNELIRGNYADYLAKHFKWNKSELNKQLNNLVEELEGEISDEDGPIKLPEWINEKQKEEFLTKGFIAVNRKVNGKPMVGFYSFNQGGKLEITNFIIHPLFHVFAGVDSRYLLQIYNGYRHAVLDVPAKVIPSIDQFQGYTVSEGNFLIFGAKPQWLRIASELLQNFPRCMELNILGWQNFAFFAWVDKIYQPGEGLKDLDRWGIINIKPKGEGIAENFLIPASCEAYKQLQRTGDDPYENDRYLTYKMSPVTFSQWSKQMQRVYLQAGVVAVAYAILTLFRDIVFEVDNNCPHLYAFGEPSSGKSKWAESITAIFYYKRSAFNLNSGTDFAFFSYMQRYANCPAHLNEFEIEVIKPEWFQAIKGIYDGESRERGKGGSKNRTEVMRVRGTLVLTGQKLVTADDNSVVTRSLIEPFSTRDNLSETDKKAYDELKGWESQGMSSMLVELLQHREYVEKHYKQTFNDQLSQWRKERQETRSLNQRILQNFAHLATCYALMANFIKLPQSVIDFTEYCYKQSIKWSQFIRSSDTLSEFWRTLEFLVNQEQIHEGWDYIIRQEKSIRIRQSREKEVDHTFDAPTKVLYIRLNNIHKLFQQAYRTRTGKEAMNIENLLHYFSSRKYFVGPVKQMMFKRFVTVTDSVTKAYGINTVNEPVTSKKEFPQKSSCYAFVYEELGIEIEAWDGNAEESIIPTSEEVLNKAWTAMPTNGEDELPFPIK